MHVGKTLFAQVMEFIPWTSFSRIVQRYSGNAGARTLSCAEQFRAMAFAQLTWRESLRDVEASLSANATKLYAMGFRSTVKRSTPGRRERTARLAYLVGPCRIVDPSSAQALCERRARCRVGQHGLCAGRRQLPCPADKLIVALVQIFRAAERLRECDAPVRPKALRSRSRALLGPQSAGGPD